MADERAPGPAPHPVTGRLQCSPVPPASGWPGDPATPATPVARSAADVRALAAAAPDLRALDACVSVCAACPRLVAWRERVAAERRRSFADEPYWGRPAPSFGDPAPRVLVLGLAPAAHGANRTGRMFTGDRSGDWLYAALHRAGYANQPHSRHAGDGLALTGARITAAAHCAPPANRPTGEELAACAGWLERELTLVASGLDSILALGGLAWGRALAAARGLGWEAPRPVPRFAHGAETALRTPAGRAIRMVGCYHVSQQNTFTGRLTEAMLDDAIRRL